MENTSASGASAFQRGVQAVASGATDTALVVVGERMSSASTKTTTAVIGSIVHPREHAYGVTLPSFGGLAADAYLRRHSAPYEVLASVAAKNYANGARNEYAQFQKEVSVEDAADSPLVADPPRLYDCCPTSDGAAAVVLQAAEDVGDDALLVRACASAVGTHAVTERDDLLEIESVASADAGSSAAATACEACDEIWAYDRVQCPNCGVESFREVSLNDGKLVAVTVPRVTPPGVREPNPLWVARFLNAGTQVTAQLADTDLAVGDSVMLAGDYELREEMRGPRIKPS